MGLPVLNLLPLGHSLPARVLRETHVEISQEHWLPDAARNDESHGSGVTSAERNRGAEGSVRKAPATNNGDIPDDSGVRGRGRELSIRALLGAGTAGGRWTRGRALSIRGAGRARAGLQGFDGDLATSPHAGHVPHVGAPVDSFEGRRGERTGDFATGREQHGVATSVIVPVRPLRRDESTGLGQSSSDVTADLRRDSEFVCLARLTGTQEIALSF